MSGLKGKKEVVAIVQTVRKTVGRFTSNVA